MGQVAKKHEPQGEWLSEQEIAKRCGLHRQTVAARLEDLGYEPDAERSNAKLKVHFFTDAMRFEIKAARDEMTAMKIRDMRASAHLKELKLARERGEVVDAVEMVELVQAVVSNLYQEYTVRQPKRIAPKLAKAKSLIEVKKILKVDHDRIMKELRANFERYLTNDGLKTTN